MRGNFTIAVHHLNNSRSQRVLWLLEELELPYEIKHYQCNPKTMLAPPSLREVHPSPRLITCDYWWRTNCGWIGSHCWVLSRSLWQRTIETCSRHTRTFALTRAGLNESRPKLMAFLNRIHSRPAYQQALERGGDYSLLGWVEPKY